MRLLNLTRVLGPLPRSSSEPRAAASRRVRSVRPSLQALEERKLMAFDSNPILQVAASDYGINLTLPGVEFAEWTTQQDEPGAIRALKLPLRDNVTYYSATVTDLNGGALSFGGVTAMSDGYQSLSVVIDPADPCVFIEYSTAEGGAGIGFSKGAKIPFTPSATNYGGPRFSGDLWGTINNVKIPETPFEASGSLTINLDGLGTGTALDFKHDAKSLFASDGLLTLDYSKLDFGVNGSIAFAKGGFSANVANASLGFAPIYTTPSIDSAGSFL